MASTDKEGAPSPGSPWASILQTVREQLPSLDSDSSLSDCGEQELFIFQRDDAVLIPDLSEELAEDPDEAWSTLANGSPPEPAGVTPEPWSQWITERAEDPGGLLGSRGGTSSLPSTPKETSKWQEGDLGDTSFNWQAPRSAPCRPWGEASLSGRGEGGRKTESPSAASQGCQASDAAGRRRALRRERRKMIEKDILHRVACTGPQEAAAPGPSPDARAEGPQEGPLVLSLQQFEDRELDNLLESLTGPEERGARPPGSACWAAADLQRSGHAEPSTQDRLMEQLALFCASQSRPSLSRRALTDVRRDTCPQARSSCTLQEPGSQAELGSSGTSRLKQQSWGPQPSTVFIDLRPNKPAPCQGLQDSPSPSPSSSEDEEAEEEKAAPAGQESPSPQRPRDCTGKSRLLQQLRAFRKRMAQAELADCKVPAGQRTQGPEDLDDSSMAGTAHTSLT